MPRSLRGRRATEHAPNRGWGGKKTPPKMRRAPRFAELLLMILPVLLVVKAELLFVLLAVLLVLKALENH